MSHSPEIETLTQRAWELINESSLEEARAIGAEIKNAGSEAGYRIVALTFAMEEDYPSAIAELESGIKAMPETWELHLQLGNILSDTEQYDAAIRTFDHASRLPGAEKHWLSLNKAVVYARKMDVDRALNILQKIDHPDAINEAFELQYRLLDQLGRHDLIIEMEEELEYLQVPEDEKEAAVMAGICIILANAYWYEDNEEAARHYLRQSIEYNRINPEALELMRELDAEFSDTARIFSLVVQGILHQPEIDEPFPFLTTYGLIAEDEAHALNLIREFEVDAVDKDSLEIVETETTENEDEEAIGLYMVGGFGFLE